MTRLDLLDKIASSITMRDELRFKAAFDEAFMEEEWIRSFEIIEEIMVALLFTFGIRVDADRDQFGNHRFHSNVLRAMDDSSSPFNSLLGKRPGSSGMRKAPLARRYISDLRMRRNDAKSQIPQDASETLEGVHIRPKIIYRQWYETVIEAMVNCLKICMEYNTCKEHCQVQWPRITCTAGCGGAKIFYNFQSWKKHALVHHPEILDVPTSTSGEALLPFSSSAAVVSDPEAALCRIAELEKENADLKATSNNAKKECTRLSRCLESTVQQHKALSNALDVTESELVEESKRSAARFEEGKAIGARDVWQRIDALREGRLEAYSSIFGG